VQQAAGSATDTVAAEAGEPAASGTVTAK
jgi:hypothetical protein